MGFWSRIFDEMLHGPLEERLELNRQLQQRGEEIAKAGNVPYVVVIESNWGYAGGYHEMPRCDVGSAAFLSLPSGKRFAIVGENFYVLEGKTGVRSNVNTLPEKLKKLPSERLGSLMQFVYPDNWIACVSADLGHWEFAMVAGKFQPVWELNEKGIEEYEYRNSGHDSVTGAPS